MDGAPVGRPGAGRRVAAQVAVVLGLAVLAGLVSALGPNDPWHNWFDLRVYDGAVEWWRAGRPLYDYTFGRTDYGFTYPPFAALAVLPMTLLSIEAVAAVHAGLNLLVLAGITAWLVAPPARRHGWPAPA